jgi:hypothetical protein
VNQLSDIVMQLLVFLICASLWPLQAQNSDLVHKIQDLNKSVIVRNTEDLKGYSPQKVLEAAQEIKKLTSEYIVRELQNNSGITSRQLEQKLGNLQGDLKLPTDITNTPKVWRETLAGDAVVIAAMLYESGGVGSPGTHPLLQCFAKHGPMWRLIAHDASDFEDYTLYVQKIESRQKGELWWLLYGVRMGDNDRRLRAELVSFNGTALTSRWQRSGLSDGEIAITSNGVTLNYRDEQRYTENKPPYFIREKFVFTENGLEHMSRQ